MSTDTLSTDSVESDTRVVETEVKSAAPQRRFSALDLWQSFGPVVVCLAIVALVFVLNRAFFGGGGPGILALQATFILLVALGHYRRGAQQATALERRVAMQPTLQGVTHGGRQRRSNGKGSPQHQHAHRHSQHAQR